MTSGLGLQDCYGVRVTFQLCGCSSAEFPNPLSQLNYSNQSSSNGFGIFKSPTPWFTWSLCQFRNGWDRTVPSWGGHDTARLIRCKFQELTHSYRNLATEGLSDHVNFPVGFGRFYHPSTVHQGQDLRLCNLDLRKRKQGLRSFFGWLSDLRV